VTRLLGGGTIKMGELPPSVMITGGFSLYLNGIRGLPPRSLESEEMKRILVVSYSLSTGKV